MNRKELEAQIMWNGGGIGFGICSVAAAMLHEMDRPTPETPDLPSIVAIGLPKEKYTDDGAKFTLDGDLSQMANQETFLRNAGFRVGRIDVYPGLYTEEDHKAALKMIWDNRVDGWWHYDKDYLKYGICTKEQFDTRLGVKK